MIKITEARSGNRVGRDNAGITQRWPMLLDTNVDTFCNAACASHKEHVIIHLLYLKLKLQLSSEYTYICDCYIPK